LARCDAGNNRYKGHKPIKAGRNHGDGLAMADRVTQQDRLVLIELGGNDFISGEPSEDFERSLEGVLAKLDSPKRTIVMFELPLLPEMVTYGRVQRRLARRYGVWLIPKRCLTAVISGKDATSDGLHLTDVGTHRMASLVAQVLSPVLKSS
jgi:acyl-CoA thioesterase I